MVSTTPTLAPTPPAQQTPRKLLVGTLDGEGVGPEVIAATLRVAHAVARKDGFDLQIEAGGVIGLESKQKHAAELSLEVVDFCADIARRGGSILSGPGGGRYVYDLRRQFRLFYKINPLHSFAELAGASRLKIDPASLTDIVLVRENLEGIYQGMTSELSGAHLRTLSHTFHSSEQNVRLLMERAAAVAAQRARHVTVIVKRGGLPAISALWEDCAQDVIPKHAVRFDMMDVDFASYQLLQKPAAFDVIVTPNCFGDILADIGGLLFGSRGITYGASYSADGFGVYQTNHGCAYDLAGKDLANPVGQIFSLAMMLRENFGLPKAADTIVSAVRSVWSQGWRTADLVEDGCRQVGTQEMGRRIEEMIGNDPSVS